MTRTVVMSLTLAIGGCSAAEETRAPPTTPTPLPSAEATTPTSSPTATPPVSPTPASGAMAAGTYLALGDSLAVGVGASRPAETGYVGLLFEQQSGAEPAAARLVNLAVSGETSSSMIRNGQLAAALEAIATADPPLTLVTLDIGGNDLLHLLSTETCAAAPQGQECLQLLALTLADFEANYRQIIGELTDALQAGSPGARLAVMTYFNPFSGTEAAYEAAGELALLGADGGIDCAADDARSRGMNDIIVCIGEELGAIPIDIQPAFAGLGLELTHIGAEDIHANDEGYRVIADLFVTALRR